MELKFPENGSVSLPRSKEESRCRGSSVGEESGEESTHRPGDDGGEEKAEVYAGGWRLYMEEERKKAQYAQQLIFIWVPVISTSA